MSLITIFGIAVALAMDAFAVALAVGISLKQISARQTFRLSWHFGLFQALMPIFGWWLGSAIRIFIEQFAHWLAFIMLAAVGGNMLREAFVLEHEAGAEVADRTRGLTMVMLSIATSIDALAVGFSMSLLDITIVTPAIIIGLVAALFTIAGMHLGKKISTHARLSVYAEIFGGLMLFAIGIKILHEHKVFTFLF